jgi:hypothetical protein
MALSAEEKAQLDALTAKANEPDTEDDFEIELYTPGGHGARVPYSKGRGYLQEHFGIDLDPDPGKDGGEGGDGSAGGDGKGKPPKGTPKTGEGSEGPDGKTYWSRNRR